MVSSNRNLGAMDPIGENSENLAGATLAGWTRAMMGLGSGASLEQQNYAFKLKGKEPEQSMSYSGSPLSPKNQQPRTQSGTKRPSFAFPQQDDDELIRKSAKRAKTSHDAVLLAMLRSGAVPGAIHNPFLGTHLQPQPPLASASPLLLNPALLAAAATTGYASTAATQQLMLSQALANTTGVNPVVQQQINSLIHSELARLAGADAEVAPKLTPLSAPHMPPKSDPPTATDETTMDQNGTVACLGLGKEFLPAATQRTRLCDCGMSLCHEIGYPHRGSIPFSAASVDQWCKALDITGTARLQAIKDDPEKFSLAFWHFRQEHQTVNELTGRLALQKSVEALPDVHLQMFIDEYKGGDEEREQRRPSMRMMELHKRWVQFHRPATLEP